MHHHKAIVLQMINISFKNFAIGAHANFHFYSMHSHMRYTN